MEKEQKIAWWRYVLAVIAYCVLFFVGGAVLVIWNALSPRAYKFVPGELGYSVMQILTGPVGVLIADYTAKKILGEERSILPFTLNVFGAALAAFLAIFPWIESGNFTRNTLSILLSCVVACVCAANRFSEYKDEGKGGGRGKDS